MVRRGEKDKRSNGTQADRAYRLIKQGILYGEFAEGSFLQESEILGRLKIGRTPFREACNRLHNEQLLEVVPRRGYFVPEPSYRAVRDLFETRIAIEGIAAELAALRAEPPEVDELDALYKEVLLASRRSDSLGQLIEANGRFHLQIGRMTHNRELETILRGLLERSGRLVYLAATSSKEISKQMERLLKPVVTAIRAKDSGAAHRAVVEDIRQGQLNALGTDIWGAERDLPAERAGGMKPKP
jgi:DNA-binding GntR family transcriptional regulator